MDAIYYPIFKNNYNLLISKHIFILMFYVYLPSTYFRVQLAIILSTFAAEFNFVT